MSTKICHSSAAMLCGALALLLLVLPSPRAQVAVSGEEMVTSRTGMASTAHPLASEAAMDIIRKGGNAVDAAVAAAFAIGVVEPDGSGLGGGGAMVIYLNNTREAHFINYYQMAPRDVISVNYNPETDRHTGKAVLIPGTVAGLTEALSRFGTMPLSDVMEPAIRYAEEGFEVDQTLAQLLLDNSYWIQEFDSAATVFLDEGFPLMEGALLRQPQMAQTLKVVAEKGRAGFYEGPVAEAIVAEVRRDGGALSLEDMAQYRAEVSKPLFGTYRGYEVYSAGVPQSGQTVIQILNMLEQVDLKKMGHYSGNAKTLHLMAEAFRRAYADRWQYMGDPNFADIPVNGLISKAYGRDRFGDINPFMAEPRSYRETTVGYPFKYDNIDPAAKSNVSFGEEGRERWSDDANDEGKSSYDEWGEDLFDSWGGAKKKDKDKKIDKKIDKKRMAEDTANVETPPDDDEFDGHTTHLSIVDKDGNMVALTQTLGTFFGSGLMSAGVLLNCGMSNFSATSAVNMVEPLKRPRSSIAPTIILKDGKPFMVLGSPGASRIICTVVELIVNTIDFGMNVYEANWAPRFYCQKYEDYLYLEGGISQEVQEELERMGHTIRAYSDRDLFFGGAQLIYVDPVTGLYYGSADKRRGGRAEGD